MLSALILFATLAAEEGDALSEAYCFDLRSVVNVNPYEPGEVAAGEGYGLPPRYVWFEAEDAHATSRDFETVDAAEASGGEMLGGGFGEKKGDRIEFYFDAPWETEEAFVFLRTTRLSANALTALKADVNGDERATAYIPPNNGLGDNIEDFRNGLCSAAIGPVRVGRQVVRLRADQDNEPLRIDCVWIASGQINIVNQVDSSGRIHDPAPAGSVIYTPGLRTIHDYPFDLIDPWAESRKTILAIQEETREIPIDEGPMSTVAVLATSAGPKSEATLLVTYADGQKKSYPFTVGPFFTKRPQANAMRLGSDRVGYVEEIDIDDGDVIGIAIESKVRLLVLGVSFRAVER